LCSEHFVAAPVRGSNPTKRSHKTLEALGIRPGILVDPKAKIVSNGMHLG
jgi:hypothetical protein